jgi:hypothetical protein
MADSNVTTGWSGIYEFATSQAVGLTAMGVATYRGVFLGVFAVDYELGSISSMLNLTVVGSQGTWAYIVERSNGKLLGVTTGDKLYDKAAPGPFLSQRLSAAASANPSIAASAQLLAGEGWPERYKRNVSATDAGTDGWEFQSRVYKGPNKRLDWMLVVGQDIRCDASQVWNSLAGRCTPCPAGQEPQPSEGKCVDCKAGFAGSNGRCTRCADGQEPNGDQTGCTRCQAGWAGVKGRCQQCDRSQESSVNSTYCQCKDGTYDSWQPQPLQSGEALDTSLNLLKPSYRSYVFCWKGARVPGATGFEDDSLNEASKADLRNVGHPSDDKRCIACPKCVTCEEGIASIKRGFGFVPTAAASPLSSTLTNNSNSSHSRRALAPREASIDTNLDVYKCPLDVDENENKQIDEDEAICQGIDGRNFAALKTTSEDLAKLTCRLNYDGILCGTCKDGYSILDGECLPCAHISPQTIVVWGSLVLLILVVVLIWLMDPFEKCGLKQWFQHGYKKLAIVLSKAWPRIKQSFRILVTNLQITSQIGSVANIELPETFVKIVDSVGKYANINVFHVPGMSCVAGGSYFFMWGTKVAIIPVSVLLLAPWSAGPVYRAFKAREYKKDEWKGLDENNEDGEYIEDAQVRVGIKLKRALAVGQIKSHLHSLIFFIVYLLYPSSSKAVFDMLRCRELDNGEQVLKADYAQQCNLPGGEKPGDYQFFFMLAIFLVFCIPFGIPLYFGYFLHKNRESVMANPKYVALVGLRPLFQFYKKDCYMWEVYFMLQKVVLVGLMGFLEGSVLQAPGNILITVIVLCALCRKMPSGTPDYNKANIVSQCVILITYISTMILKGEEGKSSSSIDPDKLSVVLLFLQSVMFVYLFYLSLFKLVGMLGQSAREAEVELAIKAANEAKGTSRDNTIVSKEERQTFKAAFESFDADGNGGISMKEIEMVLNDLGEKLTPEEEDALKEIARKSDSDDIKFYKRAPPQALLISHSGVQNGHVTDDRVPLDSVAQRLRLFDKAGSKGQLSLPKLRKRALTQLQRALKKTSLLPPNLRALCSPAPKRRPTGCRRFMKESWDFLCGVIRLLYGALFWFWPRYSTSCLCCLCRKLRPARSERETQLRALRELCQAKVDAACPAEKADSKDLDSIVAEEYRANLVWVLLQAKIINDSAEKSARNGSRLASSYTQCDNGNSRSSSLTQCADGVYTYHGSAWVEPQFCRCWKRGQRWWTAPQWCREQPTSETETETKLPVPKHFTETPDEWNSMTREEQKAFEDFQDFEDLNNWVSQDGEFSKNLDAPFTTFKQLFRGKDHTPKDIIVEFLLDEEHPSVDLEEFITTMIECRVYTDDDKQKIVGREMIIKLLGDKLRQPLVISRKPLDCAWCCFPCCLSTCCLAGEAATQWKEDNDKISELKKFRKELKDEWEKALRKCGRPSDDLQGPPHRTLARASTLPPMSEVMVQVHALLRKAKDALKATGEQTKMFESGEKIRGLLQTAVKMSKQIEDQLVEGAGSASETRTSGTRTRDESNAMNRQNASKDEIPKRCKVVLRKAAKEEVVSGVDREEKEDLKRKNTLADSHPLRLMKPELMKLDLSSGQSLDRLVAETDPKDGRFHKLEMALFRSADPGTALARVVKSQREPSSGNTAEPSENRRQILSEDDYKNEQREEDKKDHYKKATSRFTQIQGLLSQLTWSLLRENNFEGLKQWVVRNGLTEQQCKYVKDIGDRISLTFDVDPAIFDRIFKPEPGAGAGARAGARARAKPEPEPEPEPEEEYGELHAPAAARIQAQFRDRVQRRRQQKREQMMNDIVISLFMDKIKRREGSQDEEAPTVVGSVQSTEAAAAASVLGTGGDGEPGESTGNGGERDGRTEPEPEMTPPPRSPQPEPEQYHRAGPGPGRKLRRP